MTTIRPLHPDDKDQWRGLWHDYLTFYGTTRPAEIFETHFARLIGDDPRDYKGLVAVDGEGRLVGLAHYLFHRHGWSVEDVCYLQDLYIAPEQRGQRLGRRLIEAVYAAADEAGAAQVYWLTQEDNAEARKLYDRIGMLTPFIKYQRR
jgi:GNAT superfamily N-acetyltransferase